jgi:mannose-6-phosphate isomerase-like protein (cupin superfamily)
MRRVEFDETSSLGRLLTSGVAPEVMPKHKREFQVFRYSEPELSPGKTKAITRLCTTDLTYGAMQKMVDGGGSAMHYHAAMDGFWMVIKGEALFTDENGREHHLFPLDGVMVPRGTPYQFYQTGSEPLVLLQVEGLNAKATRNTTKREGVDERDPQTLQKVLQKIELFDAMEEEAS